MGFRQGLLRARGQIAFLAALVCSTGVIIYLETLDAESRIREQVVASIAATGESEFPLSLRDTAEVALAKARRDFARAPNVAAHRAALLNAAVLGIAQGLGSASQHRSDSEEVLALLDSEPPEQTKVIAPALTLLAAAIPEFEPKISALLARE